MTAAKPRPCPRCAASATKSRAHCPNCDWRWCAGCNQPYDDTTPTATKETKQ